MMKNIIHADKTSVRRILGIAAVIFYILYSCYYIADHKPYNMVWVCHIGCLLVGIGLITGSAVINAAGFFWICIGIPLWVINLFAGLHSVVFSYLTHWGGFICGAAGIMILGMPRYAWIRAGAMLAVFVPLTKFITPAYENVNLIHRIWDGWENFYPSFAVYLLAAFSYCLIIFFLIEKLYRIVHVKRFFCGK